MALVGRDSTVLDKMFLCHVRAVAVAAERKKALLMVILRDDCLTKVKVDVELVQCVNKLVVTVLVSKKDG